MTDYNGPVVVFVCSVLACFSTGYYSVSQYNSIDMLQVDMLKYVRTWRSKT